MDQNTVSVEQMAAYFLGELDAAGRTAVEQAASASSVVAEALRSMRVLVETMRTDDSAVPSRAVLDRAKGIAAGSSMAEMVFGKVAGWWERVADGVAGLVFDSRAQLAASGFRGGAAGTQLAFASEDAEVDLMATEGSGEAGEGTWTVRGQVESLRGDEIRAVAIVPGSDAGREVGEDVIELVPDEHGQFRFETRASAFAIRVLAGGRVIDVGGPAGVRLG